MNIKLSKKTIEEKAITLIALVITIVVLLILSSVSIAMLTGSNGIITKANDAKMEAKKAEYLEIIRLAHLESKTINMNVSGTKILDDVYDILYKDKKLGKGTGTTIDKQYNIEGNPRLLIKTKENFIYTVTEETVKSLGIVEGDIPIDVDLDKAKISFDCEPKGWTNQEVTVKASIEAEEYKGYSIQYSLDANEWKDYTDEGVTFKENGMLIVRLKYGTSISNQYQEYNVTSIDKEKPVVTEVTATTNTITIKATDNDSGIIGYAVTTDNNEPTDFTSCANTKSLDTSVGEKQQGTTYYVWVKDEAGNISNSESTETDNVAGLTQADITFNYSPSEWTKGDVTVTANANIDITGYTLKVSQDLNTWDDKVTVSENGEVYAVLMDTTNQKGKYATGNVTNIDKTPPKEFTPTATSTVNSISINASTTDSESGIAGYCMSINNGSWTDYQTSGTFGMSGIPSNTSFTIKIKAKDNVGNERESTSITIATQKRTYTISYDANGGTGAPAAQTKTEGTNLTLSTTVPTRDGYKFKGWATSSSATTVEYASGATYSSDSQVTLYAVWLSPTIVSTISTGYASSLTLKGSVAVPVYYSNRLNLSTDKEYLVEFDYYCLSGTNRFNVDFFPDTLPQILPVATTTKQHYKWITSSSNSDMNSCYLRFFDDQQESNESDIIISNISLYEIKWDE